MSYYDKLTEKEISYIEEVLSIGKLEGNSESLQIVCKKAYKDYLEKKISSEAYSKIYSICCDYAYPH